MCLMILTSQVLEMSPLSSVDIAFESESKCYVAVHRCEHGGSVQIKADHLLLPSPAAVSSLMTVSLCWPSLYFQLRACDTRRHRKEIAEKSAAAALSP